MQRFLVAAVAAVFLSLSCASAPAAPAKSKAPDWTLKTPAPDATNTYFVGYASAPGGDEAAAANDAAANLVSEIMKYMGVKISVDSKATSTSTLNSYSAQVQSTVTAQSSGRLAGFIVKEKYVAKDKKTGQVIVYVLAAYATDELRKEQNRILAKIAEAERAVSVPESEGRSLVEGGRNYEAVRKFVEAAAAASGADIDNADVKLERNVNNARNALAKLRFDKLGVDGYSAFIGQPFPKPFKLRLVAGEGEGAPGVPGATLQVSYQRKQGTRLIDKTESAVTDGSGVLSYSPPPPDFVGKARLRVQMDFQSSISLLEGIPEQFASYRDALVEDLKGKYVEIPYEVASGARSVATGVAIVDLAESGAQAAGAQAQAGLVDTLTKAKFNVRSVAVDGNALAAMDEAAAVAAAKAAGLARIAFGAAKIDSIRKDGSNYIVSAKAQLKVIEVATGRILYSGEKAAMGFGPDEQSARRSAYRELGANALGKDLLSNLP